MNYYPYIIAALILNMFIFDKIPLLRYILTPLAGLTLALISAPLGFIWMTLFVWFIKKDKEPSLGSYPTDLRIKYNCIIRGDLPKLLRWGQPVDDRFPGPMYEPLIEKIYLKYGFTAASWWNGAIRNQMFGLAAAIGKPTTDYAPEVNNWKRDDVWAIRIPTPFYNIVAGWQIYKKLDDTFLAVPVCTLKRTN